PGLAVKIGQINLLAIISVSALSNSSYAEPNKVLYELQERCAKHASDTFKKEIGGNVTKTNDGETMIGNYENHYSGRLNKCFYLETTTILHKTKDRKLSKSLRLFDLHENREVGTYFQFDGSPPMQCTVGDGSCRTEQEWRVLVKPFMED